MQEIPIKTMDQLIRSSKLSKQLQVMTAPERQIVLHDIQDQIGALRQQYRDHELDFKALGVAYEAVRLAWYAVGQNEDRCREKMEYLDASVQRLAEHLLIPALPEPPAPVEAEPEPIPVQFPDWLKEAA